MIKQGIFKKEEKKGPGGEDSQRNTGSFGQEKGRKGHSFIAGHVWFSCRTTQAQADLERQKKGNSIIQNTSYALQKDLGCPQKTLTPQNALEWRGN